jgi:hypothetical protein
LPVTGPVPDLSRPMKLITSNGPTKGLPPFVECSRSAHVNSTPTHPVGPERPDLPAEPERLTGLDPRDVILLTEEVHAYYRLCRTAGYALTSGPLAPYRAAPGRLADLHRFQEDSLAGSVN